VKWPETKQMSELKDMLRNTEICSEELRNGEIC